MIRPEFLHFLWVFSCVSRVFAQDLWYCSLRFSGSCSISNLPRSMIATHYNRVAMRSKFAGEAIWAMNQNPRERGERRGRGDEIMYESYARLKLRKWSKLMILSNQERWLSRETTFTPRIEKSKDEQHFRRVETFKPRTPSHIFGNAVHVARFFWRTKTRHIDSGNDTLCSILYGFPVGHPMQFVTSIFRKQVAREAYQRLLHVRPCLREVDAAGYPFFQNLTRLSNQDFGITYSLQDSKVREQCRKSCQLAPGSDQNRWFSIKNNIKQSRCV